MPSPLSPWEPSSKNTALASPGETPPSGAWASLLAGLVEEEEVEEEVEEEDVLRGARGGEMLLEDIIKYVW